MLLGLTATPEDQPPSPLQISHQPQPLDDISETVVQENGGDFSTPAKATQNPEWTPFKH